MTLGRANENAFAASICAAIITFLASGQNPPVPAAGQTPAPTADPYANNAKAGTQTFPLAAPAGKDSGAKLKALPGGVNGLN